MKVSLSSAIIIIEDMARTLDNQAQVDLLSPGFSKAFGTVPHRGFLNKLEKYGVKDQVYD